MSDTVAELAVRVARAEIERDEAVARAKRAEDAWAAVYSGDKEKLLDTLHIIGMPARDLVDIYQVVQDWNKAGGRPNLLELYRQLWELQAQVESNTNSRPE